MFKKFVLLFGLVLSMNAATLEAVYKVKMISLFSNKVTHVQTEPKHSINGLKCTDNYWAMLSRFDDAHNEMLSMLTTAMIADRKVIVTVSDDDKTDRFCRISRIILTK